jgi:carbonic anhydrase
MNLAATAKKEVLARDDLKTAEQRIDACEKAAISHSLKNLMSYPWINQRVNSGSLELLGCYYDLRSGELISLDEVNAEVMKGR